MNIGGKILRFSTLPSTNDLARELALRGGEEGTVVIAEEQTKGRGTKGRSWYSARGLGLYLSVLLRPTRSEASLLPLTAGVAVRDALAGALSVGVGLKWPNDLIWQGKKMAGILCESGYLGATLNYVILGIGLNINHQVEDFPEELRSNAVSLLMACGREVKEEEVLAPLWAKLSFWYHAFLEKRDQEIIQNFELYNIFQPGDEIIVEAGAKVVQGRFSGFSPEGALCLASQGQKLTFATGEVSLIRRS